SEFQFRDMIADLTALYDDISTGDVKVSAHVAPSVPAWIEADRGRISQILNNLLSNAVKFTIKGSIRIGVDLVEKKNCLPGKATENGKVCIKVEVSDTGIGIPKEKLQKLFTPFVQIDDSEKRDHDGTGLGLSICKQLAELHGGLIGVDSEPGEGSTFWFTFLAKLVKPATTRKDSKDEKVDFPVKLRILLAEDKPISQKVVSLMLTHMGHSVVIANHGEEVLEKYEPGKFDLILMDIQMPVMDGITATGRLRKMYTQLPPIVGLSANAFEGDRERYMGAGLDEYVTKPLKKEKFLRLIEQLFCSG
ncbi:MAG: ATP-binding protein, partial [Bacteroidota bacterium]